MVMVATKWQHPFNFFLSFLDYISYLALILHIMLSQFLFWDVVSSSKKEGGGATLKNCQTQARIWLQKNSTMRKK